MKHTTLKQNRVWLFAFADLAFIMLIAVTQFFSTGETIYIEMQLPEVIPNEKTDVKVSKKQIMARHLIIHKPSSKEDKERFQLCELKSASQKIPGGKRLSRESLEKELKDLIKEKYERPSIVPDANSLTGDLFYAATLLDDIWKNSQGKAIATPIKNNNVY
ncbi:hypothetical protein MHK_006112 [Candidatus Magnetomorum sp. HK-1]|nr:hypothetical protein MHK_006112 [Candidatus Magnetomorum sp. HK-1]